MCRCQLISWGQTDVSLISISSLFGFQWSVQPDLRFLGSVAQSVTLTHTFFFRFVLILWSISAPFEKTCDLINPSGAGLCLIVKLFVFQFGTQADYLQSKSRFLSHSKGIMVTWTPSVLSVCVCFCQSYVCSKCRLCNYNLLVECAGFCVFSLKVCVCAFNFLCVWSCMTWLCSLVFLSSFLASLLLSLPPSDVLVGGS